MKYISLVLLGFSIFWTGCNSSAPNKTSATKVYSSTIYSGTYSQDIIMVETYPPPARAFVDTHPRLRKICDLAGECDNVKIECTKYDGAGNTILRNDIVWEIEALGVHGFGFASHTKKPLEEAISDWFEMYRYHIEKSPEIIYPNASPCDSNCKP